MDWTSIFSQRDPQFGATGSEIMQLVASIFLPLSAGEIRDAQAQCARNPVPVTHPLHAQFRPFDPSLWQLPNAALPASFLEFLRFSNGGNFGNGDRWFQFFPAMGAQHGLRAMMLAYEFPQYMPFALPFAFNDGGTFYAFDLRRSAINGEYPIVASHASTLGWDSDECHCERLSQPTHAPDFGRRLARVRHALACMLAFACPTALATTTDGLAPCEVDSSYRAQVDAVIDRPAAGQFLLGFTALPYSVWASAYQEKPSSMGRRTISRQAEHRAQGRGRL